MIPIPEGHRVVSRENGLVVVQDAGHDTGSDPLNEALLKLHCAYYGGDPYHAANVFAAVRDVLKEAGLQLSDE